MGQTNTILYVKGNTLPLAVPLRTKTAVNGAWVTEDYTPPADSDIHAFLVGKYKRYEYDFTLDGNIVKFTDDGSLPIGDYGVEVTVQEPQKVNRRTFKCQQIRIVNCTDELGMLPDGEVVLDAAVFIQGEKGDKGDPFTYEDFTPSEIEELQKPARDAAAELQQDYNTNVKQDYSEVKQDAQAATSAANGAAGLANEKAGLANQKAQYAEQQGDYAKNQGDYAKRKADEIEDAKGTYDNLDARLDAMDADTGTKMDAPTEEEFNGIFN